MDNIPVWADGLIAYLVAASIFHLIYLLDRRTKMEGSLFSQPPSAKSRIFALLIGLLLGGAFVVLWILGYQNGSEAALIAVAAIALIAYSLGLDRPLRGIQKSYAEIFHRTNAMGSKKIIGIDEMVINQIDDLVHSGAKFVVFDYCISPLVVTLDYVSDVFFVRPGDDARKRGIRYSFLSLLLGWYSILGPIHTIRCLISNMRGGRDVTRQIYDWIRWVRDQAQQADAMKVEARIPN